MYVLTYTQKKKLGSRKGVGTGAKIELLSSLEFKHAPKISGVVSKMEEV